MNKRSILAMILAYVVPGAGHVDLYDRVELIPWDKLASFFTQHLR